MIQAFFRTFVIICLCVTSLLAPALQQDTPSTLPQQFTVSGTVVDKTTGEPIEDARITIVPAAQRDASHEVVTTANGRFVVGGLLPGKYRLAAERRGFLTESYDQHDHFSSLVVVGPGLPSENLKFLLKREASISGTIMDEQGETVRNAHVMLFQTGIANGIRTMRIPQQQVTNGSGAYRFSHLAPGMYFIVVSAEPWYAQHPGFTENETKAFGETTSSTFSLTTGGSNPDKETSSSLDVCYPITFYPGETDPNAALPAKLSEGEKMTADVSLHPAPSLHFRIFTGHDNSVKREFALLTKPFFDASLPVYALSTQVTRGYLELGGIPAGSYTMKVTSWGNSSAVTEDVDVSGNLELNQSQGGSSVHFAVFLKAGAAEKLPSRGNLYLRNKKTGEARTIPLSDMRNLESQQKIAPGSYDLALKEAPDDMFISSISAIGANVTGRTLTINENQSVKLRIELAQGKGEVNGVALRAGKAYGGTTLILVPDDASNNLPLLRVDQSNTDGSFAFSSVVPGKYMLLAVQDGWQLEWDRPDVLKAIEGHGQVLEVAPRGKYDLRIRVEQIEVSQP